MYARIVHKDMQYITKNHLKSKTKKGSMYGSECRPNLA